MYCYRYVGRWVYANTTVIYIYMMYFCKRKFLNLRFYKQNVLFIYVYGT